MGKSKEQKAADRRARYQARIAARLCHQCGAGLIDDEPGTLCPECDERAANARQAWSARNPEKRKLGRGKVKPETRRAKYHEKLAAKICVAQGCREARMRNHRMCRKHAHAHAGYSLKCWRRKHGAETGERAAA